MIKLTLFITLLLIVVGCTKEVPANQMVERGGVWYEVNSTTPFTGTTIRYHNNGQLQEKGNFKDGKFDGLSESFHKNGQLEISSNWKDGKLNGLLEEYHDNGQLYEKTIYKDGEGELLESYFQNGEKTWRHPEKD